MEELRDIKGLVEVTDYSFYYLLGVSGLGVLIVILLAVFIYKQITKKEKMTQKKLAMELLNKFEVGDTKESVYEFSRLAQYAVRDDQRQALEKLLEELEPYKYKKEVPNLDNTLKEKMTKFVKEVRRG